MLRIFGWRSARDHLSIDEYRIRSARSKTTLMSCSTITSVLPCVTSRISSTARLLSARLMPAVGSSSRITSAPPAIVIPISSARCSAYVSRPPQCPSALQADLLENRFGALLGVDQLVQVLPEMDIDVERPQHGQRTLSKTDGGETDRSLEAVRQPETVSSTAARVMSHRSQQRSVGHLEAPTDRLKKRSICGTVRADVVALPVPGAGTLRRTHLISELLCPHAIQAPVAGNRARWILAVQVFDTDLTSSHCC